ncbi:MAG: GNAT family N-acetyltransferase [Candidatus Velthaea sp.]
MITVRRATVDDISAILLLLAHVAAEDRWIATEIPFDEKTRRRRYAETLVRDDAVALVAYVDNAFAGSLTTWTDSGQTSLGMRVDAEYRGRGIGRALLEAAIVWARATRIAALRLEVFPHNHAAIALYESCGFTRTGYRERAYLRRSGERWDAIDMELRF